MPSSKDILTLCGGIYRAALHQGPRRRRNGGGAAKAHLRAFEDVAVRQALKSALEAATEKPSRSQGLSEAIAIAQRIGPFDPDFDQKRFFEEMREF